MIPAALPLGTSALPDAAKFWMPKSSELDEEGFGYFRDTWLIQDVSVREARETLAEERRITAVIDNLVTDAERFERLAAVIEYGCTEDSANDLTSAERALLGEFASDVAAKLGGLELGVSGLTHALATVRILPAASCRSHYPSEHSWSDAPVVLFATTEYRAKALRPLVESSGCTFFIDQSRPELLGVRGRSITDTMALAAAVLAHRATFVRPRATLRSTPPPVRMAQQGTLF